MATTQCDAEGRHLVGAIVSAPNLPFIQKMYEDAARKAFLHMWGDAPLPKVGTIIVLVEGTGGPVDSKVTIIRCSLADLNVLYSAYKKGRGKDSQKEEFPENAMLLAFGSPEFCQGTIRYWAAEDQGVAGWGTTLLGMLENALPCTFVWWDGQSDQTHKEDIEKLADLEELRSR